MNAEIDSDKPWSLGEDRDRPRVLIADDVAENRELLRETIEPHGFDAFLVPSGEVALRVARKVLPDLILLDIRMPGTLDGFAACQELKRNPETKDIPLIFITIDDDKASIVRAFKEGAVDYIIKPFSKEEALARVRTHVALHRMTQDLRDKNTALENEIARREEAESAKFHAEEKLREESERLTFLSEQEASRWGIDGLLGKSATFQAMARNVKKIQSAKSMSVLVTGESGTGKELIARAVHFGGQRSKRPFIPMNCSAIPRDLTESILFGHRKGSFSGALQDKKGLFEMADGGTLFLDEIGDLPLELQAKFLRVLEDSRFIPVGGSTEIEVDVRIVAATHQYLEELVENKCFRHDLYFRLAQYTIQAPALRERKEDIPLLALHFIKMFAKETGVEAPVLTEEAVARLVEYSFPGNIRELKNMMERAVIEAEDGRISVADLHFFKVKKTPKPDPETKVESEFHSSSLAGEELEIVERVKETGSLTNSECRELLGINIDRAYYLLNKLNSSGFIKRIGGHRGSRYVPGPNA